MQKSHHLHNDLRELKSEFEGLKVDGESEMLQEEILPPGEQKTMKKVILWTCKIFIHLFELTLFGAYLNNRQYHYLPLTMMLS